MGQKVTIEVIVDADGAVRGVRRVGRGLKGLEGDVDRVSNRFVRLGRVLETALGFSAAQALTELPRLLMQAGQEVFRLGTMAEETRSKFTTTFGEASGAVDAFLDDFANMAGITQTEGREVTATLGAMAQGFGMTQEESGRFSERVVRLAADMASFNNASIEDTLAAIQSGLIGEQEPLRRYGILLSAASVEQRAMADTGKRTAKELTEQDKVLARLALAYEKAGVQVGDLERTQDSTANQARALQAELREMTETLATGLLPSLGLLLDTLSMIEAGSEDALEAFARLVAEGVLEVVEATLLLGQELLTTTRILASAMGAVGQGQDILDLFLEPLQMLREEWERFNRFLAQSFSALTEFSNLWLKGWAKMRRAVGMNDEITEAIERQAEAQHRLAIRIAETYQESQRGDEEIRRSAEERRTELDALLEGIGQLVSATQERREEIRALLGDMAGGDDPGKEERARQLLMARLMQEGLDRELALIEEEYEEKKALIREKFPEYAGELIRLLDEWRDRAMDHAFGLGEIIDLSEDDELFEEAQEELRAFTEENEDIIRDHLADRVDAEREAARASAEAWEEYRSLALDGLRAVSDMASAVFERRMQEVDERREAELSRIDQQLDAEGLSESKRQALLAHREEQERRYAEEVREIRARQARASKAAALFEVAINTAVAVSKVWGQTGIFGVAAQIPVLAMGAAQAAAVLAQPVPSFRKGVENFEGGMAQVHKDEFVFLPPGTSVMSQTASRRLMAAAHLGARTSAGGGAAVTMGGLEERIARGIARGMKEVRFRQDGRDLVAAQDFQAHLWKKAGVR